MDQTTQLLALVAIAAVGIVFVLLILRRDRGAATPEESPFAASTEGEKICRKCGMGNLWTDRNCISCGANLPG
jgi:hypothetical protein